MRPVHIGLGRTRGVLGRHGTTRHQTDQTDALMDYAHALALATELGQPDDQARAHDGLAHAHHTLHQHEQARVHWQRALDMLTRLGIENTDDEESSVAAIRTNLVNLETGA